MQEAEDTGLGSVGKEGDMGTAKVRCHLRFICTPVSHLSCFNVLQSSQMQKEVVVWEGCLSVGDAAVVT